MWYPEFHPKNDHPDGFAAVVPAAEPAEETSKTNKNKPKEEPNLSPQKTQPEPQNETFPYGIPLHLTHFQQQRILQIQSKHQEKGGRGLLKEKLQIQQKHQAKGGRKITLS
eukprot:5712294-Amphidinium_carterae.1